MTKYKLTIGKNGKVKYRYETDCFTFETNLFCEIGEPYKKPFEDEIKQRNLLIETIELNEAPWLVDRIRKEN